MALVKRFSFKLKNPNLGVYPDPSTRSVRISICRAAARCRRSAWRRQKSTEVSAISSWHHWSLWTKTGHPTLVPYVNKFSRSFSVCQYHSIPQWLEKKKHIIPRTRFQDLSIWVPDLNGWTTWINANMKSGSSLQSSNGPMGSGPGQVAIVFPDQMEINEAWYRARLWMCHIKDTKTRLRRRLYWLPGSLFLKTLISDSTTTTLMPALPLSIRSARSLNNDSFKCVPAFQDLMLFLLNMCFWTFRNN